MKLGTPATGDDFIGRERELGELWRYLEGDHIRFPGVRRLGKTSILKRLCEQAEGHGVLASWLDVSNVSSAAQFVKRLDEAFPSGKVTEFLASCGERAGSWLARLRTINVTLPEALGGGLALELGEGQTPDWQAQAAELQARLWSQPLLILLDEFPVMLQNILSSNPQEARQLLAWLRIWRQSQGACRFVFTGSIGLQSLLERHGLADRMNDCHDYPLGPFRQSEATTLWRTFARTADEHWAVSDAVIAHALARVGWLSPYFLCLLLDESMKAARERLQEYAPAQAAESAAIEIADVDSAYEQLLAMRSRFQHWEHRLRDALPAADLAFCMHLLKQLARVPEGLTMRQLSSRLTRYEADPDLRAQRLQDLLVRLTDEGYTSSPDAGARIQFLSVPLRDWWSRNHV